MVTRNLRAALFTGLSLAALALPNPALAQWEDGVAAFKGGWSWLGILENGVPSGQSRSAADARPGPLSINAHPLVGVVDRNRDGAVGRAELIGMLEGNAALNSRSDARLRAVDTNQNGGIDLPELVQAGREYMAWRGKTPVAPARLQRRATELLAAMDKNRDGKISRREFTTASADRFLEMLDKNRDGKIDGAEWQRTLQ